MTTDTNTAAPLPICPICGKPRGFAKGFGRRISLSIEWDQITVEPVQTSCPLAGINIAAELETTGQWWNQFKINGKGAFGVIGETHCPSWILKAENLLACDDKGCKNDLLKAARRFYGSTPEKVKTEAKENQKNRAWRKKHPG